MSKFLHGKGPQTVGRIRHRTTVKVLSSVVELEAAHVNIVRMHSSKSSAGMKVTTVLLFSFQPCIKLKSHQLQFQ